MNIRVIDGDATGSVKVGGRIRMRRLGAIALTGLTCLGCVVATESARPNSAYATALNAPIVGGTGVAMNQGYIMVGGDGGIFTFGNAAFYGSAGGSQLAQPAVGVGVLPNGGGYRIVARDGGVFAYGDAGFLGSVPELGIHVSNIVGIATTSSGNGYWLVGSDGGVYSFGDAPFHNSLPGLGVHVDNIVAIAATPSGNGYWLVGRDGGIFAFGDAPFHNSLPGLGVRVNNIVAMTATRSGNGYTMIGSDGGVFNFGDSQHFGSLPGIGVGVNNVVGIANSPTGAGYWMFGSDGGVFTFGDAEFKGSLPGLGFTVDPPPAMGGPVRDQVLAIARGEIGADGSVENHGDNKVKYNNYNGVSWCSTFATWVWSKAGVPISILPFSGNVWNWGAQNGLTRPPSARPAPGDAVLFGTGPATTDSSKHIGIVESVNADGSLTTIEGNSGDRVRRVSNWIPTEGAESGNRRRIYGYVMPVHEHGGAFAGLNSVLPNPTRDLINGQEQAASQPVPTLVSPIPSGAITVGDDATTDLSVATDMPVTPPATSAEGLGEYEFRVVDDASGALVAGGTWFDREAAPRAFADGRVSFRIPARALQANHTYSWFVDARNELVRDESATVEGGDLHVVATTKTYTARFSQTDSATLRQTAARFGIRTVDVAQTGAAVLNYLLAVSGTDPADVSMPPSRGRVIQRATYSTEDAATIEANAAKFGVTGDQYLELGGRFLMYVYLIGG